MSLSKPLIFAALFTALSAVAGVARSLPDDPLGSVQWETMHKLFLAEHPVEFDSRVKVLAPQAAEDSLAVPVWVDASEIPGVRRLLVFADFNPIPKILELEPQAAAPRVGFRFKIQQASPVRAAALDGDGVWRVGGVWVDAAGGGCTLPSVGSGSEAWSSRLGEVHARLWPGEERRLRFSVVHPMDTGLAAGIPAFYLETIRLHDAADTPLAVLQVFEPVSENPVFSLDLGGSGAVKLNGRDNNGNRFWAEVGQ